MKTTFDIKDPKTVKGVFIVSTKPSWWRRVLYFLRHWKRWAPPKPPTLWATATFDDGEVVVKNGDILTCRYHIPKKDPCDPVVSLSLPRREWEHMIVAAECGIYERMVDGQEAVDKLREQLMTIDPCPVTPCPWCDRMMPKDSIRRRTYFNAIEETWSNVVTCQDCFNRDFGKGVVRE